MQNREDGPRIHATSSRWSACDSDDYGVLKTNTDWLTNNRNGVAYGGGFLRFQETPLKIAKTNQIICSFRLDAENKLK